MELTWQADVWKGSHDDYILLDLRLTGSFHRIGHIPVWI